MKETSEFSGWEGGAGFPQCCGAGCNFCMPVIFSVFSWEGEAGRLEVWEGLGANKAGGDEVCGAAVRLEL